jgi:hypothetical protein
MDKVITMLQCAIAVTETDIETLNLKLKIGDYSWCSSKQHIDEQIEDNREFIRELRKAIKKLEE